MVITPAATSMAGEQAPAGTTNGPRLPGLTEKLKLPCTSPVLQISRKPVRLLVNVTSVTPLPIVMLALPPARLGGLSSRPAGATTILETRMPAGTVSATVTCVPTGNLGPTTQVPPGAGPLGTVNVLAPAVKVNGVPTGIPGPPTLQTLSRPSAGVPLVELAGTVDPCARAEPDDTAATASTNARAKNCLMEASPLWVYEQSTFVVFGQRRPNVLLQAIFN